MLDKKKEPKESKQVETAQPLTIGMNVLLVFWKIIGRHDVKEKVPAVRQMREHFAIYITELARIIEEKSDNKNIKNDRLKYQLELLSVLTN